jgi:hypothetical protein
MLPIDLTDLAGHAGLNALVLVVEGFHASGAIASLVVVAVIPDSQAKPLKPVVREERPFRAERTIMMVAHSSARVLVQASREESSTPEWM